ncbi:MAG: PKD repeat protein [Bacteroidia bacterium]|jgi:PKD repeat protein
MKQILLTASSFVLMLTIANAQTVSSFAGKVNPDYTKNYSNNSPVVADAYFYQPEGLAWDSKGNMYVTESNKIRLIIGGKAYNRSGKLGDPSFSLGYKNGTGPAAAYYNPTGAACDAAGNVFIVDAENHAIRKMSPFVNVGNGQTVTTFAGANPNSGWGTSGYKDGNGASARFNTPKGITIDGNGNLYVTDFNNNCIRKISASGSVLTLAGSTSSDYGNKDGTGSAALFDAPYGIAMLDATNLVVTDKNNSSIRKVNITTGAVTTICGGLGFKDGSLSEARFRQLTGVAVVNGLIYVADQTAIRVIDIANNTVSTFAGLSGSVGNKNGVGTDARFGLLSGLSYDGANALFVTDVTNHIIKKITIDNLAPVADFSTTKENIAIDEETTLTDISGGKKATRRSWLVENTTGGTSNVVLVQGDYNSSKAITVKFTATGSYRVTLNVTNEYGTDNVTKTNITVSTVGGIADVSAVAGIKVYPNPVSGGVLNLHLDNGSFEHTTVRLSDLSGALVSETMVESGTNHTVNTSNLTKGLYYLTLQDKSGILTKKIVIQ